MKHDPILHVQQCQTIHDVTPCPDCDKKILRQRLREAR